MIEFKADRILDVTDLQCPMPLLKTKLALNEMKPGERLWVQATDPGSTRDIPAFIDLTAHRLLEQRHQNGTYHFLIERRERTGTC